MQTLTILYDTRCDFCRAARAWLEDQPSYVRLRFAAAGSERARALFPELDHAATLGELTVIRDDGAVYRGDKAYLMCLWALRRYRWLALRLSTPEALPAARRWLGWVSRNRSRLGRWAWLLRLRLA